MNLHEKYLPIPIEEHIVYVETDHKGKSMTNCIEEIMKELKIHSIIYLSFADKLWNRAAMVNGELSFSKPTTTLNLTFK